MFPTHHDADWFARRAAERAEAADRQRRSTRGAVARELLADEIAVHRMGELHHAGGMTAAAALSLVEDDGLELDERRAA